MERRQSVFTDAWSDQDTAEYERERTKSARSSPINILTHGGEATWLQVFINLGLGFLAQLFLRYYVQVPVEEMHNLRQQQPLNDHHVITLIDWVFPS